MPTDPGFDAWKELLFSKMDPRLSHDLNDPRQFYDYQAAYKAGVIPELDPESGEMHLSSLFKNVGHPHQFVHGVNTITGQPATAMDKLNWLLHNAGVNMWYGED